MTLQNDPAFIIRQLSTAIQNLDRRLRIVENREITAGATTAPTPEAGWSNAGAPYALVGYWKDLAGTVNLQGRAIGGAFPSVILTLPEGFRPPGTLQFQQIGNVVEVLSNGQVRTVSGSGAVTLDGISFRAAG